MISQHLHTQLHWPPAFPLLHNAVARATEAGTLWGQPELQCSWLREVTWAITIFCSSLGSVPLEKREPSVRVKKPPVNISSGWIWNASNIYRAMRGTGSGLIEDEVTFCAWWQSVAQEYHSRKIDSDSWIRFAGWNFFPCELDIK